MKFFKGIDTIDDLKSEYRRLAMEHHPDRGGSVETMQEINSEFDLAFRILEKKAPQTTNETAADFRKTFYTEHGWAGSRYNSKLRIKDIAIIVRGYVKDVYPTYKFSVTTEYFSMGCSIHVSLMEAPENIFIDERIKEAAKSQRGYHQTVEDAVKSSIDRAASGYMQNWDYYYDWMTDRTRAVLEDVTLLVNSYRYNDSDSQIDYYDTNFYTHFNIGKYDKPLKIVPRQERIHTEQVIKKAKRITAGNS